MKIKMFYLLKLTLFFKLKMVFSNHLLKIVNINMSLGLLKILFQESLQKELL